MIYLKTNPVGIDIQIQRMQEHLYDKLNTSWGCDINAYGRAYIDEDNDTSIKPIVFKGGVDYKEVLTDDKVDAQFFFVEENSETISNSCISSNNLNLIFIVNDLRKVKGSVTHYADEEIKEEVKSYIKSFWEMQSVIKGKDSLDGFDVSQLKFLYPYFVFKISGSINNY